MGLFTSKEEKELDKLLSDIHMNMSNNYKDEAGKAFEIYGKTLTEYKENNRLSPKKLKRYEEEYHDLSKKLESYSHKDQKPYWT